MKEIYHKTYSISITLCSVSILLHLIKTPTYIWFWIGVIGLIFLGISFIGKHFDRDLYKN